MPRIDSHQHFWRYTPDEYEWIDGTMVALRRDFLPQDLEPQLSHQGIDGCVAVQARQTIEETDWLLTLAEQFPFIQGVVGWAPLSSPEIANLLADYAGRHALKGLRHVVQSEPPGFLLGETFNAGIDLLGETGLTYDLLIGAHQLAESLSFVDRHPSQIIILDHLAKPPVRDRVLSPWSIQIRELAQRPHVYCKLSGLVTEADWQSWSAEGLRPYLDVALEAFGPDRLMAGSDWPVCTLASSYGRWWSTLEQWAEVLTTEERNAIFGRVAARAYQLQ